MRTRTSGCSHDPPGLGAVTALASCKLQPGEISRRSGCLCKASGVVLNQMLEGARDRVPVGLEDTPHDDGPEDCALVRLGDQSLLLTNDFGPVVGNDPVRGGRIAGLHAMSDIWACGGKPHFALAMLMGCEDHGSTMIDRMIAVQAGLRAACRDHGVDLVGGQTVIGHELMAGLAVIGSVMTEAMLRKRGATPGQAILLSKPLGIGLVVRGYSLGLADENDLDSAVRVCETANQAASTLAVQAGVSSATDVTGFGLLGHLAEMLRPDQGARIDFEKLPVLEAARGLAWRLCESEFIAGNLEYVRSRIRLSTEVDLGGLALLADPQTNGGLLVMADPDAADRLAASGVYTLIGQVTDRPVLEVVE